MLGFFFRSQLNYWSLRRIELKNLNFTEIFQGQTCLRCHVAKLKLTYISIQAFPYTVQFCWQSPNVRYLNEHCGRGLLIKFTGTESWEKIEIFKQILMVLDPKRNLYWCFYFKLIPRKPILIANFCADIIGNFFDRQQDWTETENEKWIV